MTQRQVSRDGQVTPTRAPVPTGRNGSATGGLTSKVVRMISKGTLISIVIFACGAFGLASIFHGDAERRCRASWPMSVADSGIGV